MKILLAAINAKYIHSNLAIYSLKAYADAYLEKALDYVSQQDMEINLAELLCLQQIVQDCKKQGGNYYEIIYVMKVNGFETPYNVIVFVEDDKIDYVASFTQDDYDQLASIPSVMEESDFSDSIEIAKEEALEYVPNDATVDNQETRLILDSNLSPIVIVKTVCVDDSDCRFVLDYEYNLNY